MAARVSQGCAHLCRHFVFRDGQWLAYRSKWKSRWVKPPSVAAVYAWGDTLGELSAAAVAAQASQFARRR